jgi:hypothetical protein
MRSALALGILAAASLALSCDREILPRSDFVFQDGGAMAKCGNGKCEPGESWGSCKKDCPESCGDGKCEGGETVASCFADCPPQCGNGACEPGEGNGSCPSDCAGTCGDGKCGSGEKDSCPKDCAGTCGDGACTGGENHENCPQDCPKPSCGDCVCAEGEAQSCPGDCGEWTCGNGICECAEQKSGKCPEECGGATCGDGICNAATEQGNCHLDCTPEGQEFLACAKKKCDPELKQCLENPKCEGDLQKGFQCIFDCKGNQGCLQTKCAPLFLEMSSLQGLLACMEGADCAGGGGCGNGKCDGGETSESCPQDCPKTCTTAADCPADQTCDAGGKCVLKSPGCGDGKCASNEGVSCPQDCAGVTCEGKCGTYLTSVKCGCEPTCVANKDCCPDYPGVCGPPAGCGDGKCDADDQAKGCTLDCDDWQASKLMCAKKACPKEANQCLPNAKCVQALQATLSCVQKCKSDAGCMVNCVQGNTADSPEAESLLACAVGADCLLDP